MPDGGSEFPEKTFQQAELLSPAKLEVRQQKTDLEFPFKHRSKIWAKITRAIQSNTYNNRVMVHDGSVMIADGHDTMRFELDPDTQDPIAIPHSTGHNQWKYKATLRNMGGTPVIQIQNVAHFSGFYNKDDFLELYKQQPDLAMHIINTVHEIRHLDAGNLQ